MAKLPKKTNSNQRKIHNQPNFVRFLFQCQRSEATTGRASPPVSPVKRCWLRQGNYDLQLLVKRWKTATSRDTKQRRPRCAYRAGVWTQLCWRLEICIQDVALIGKTAFHIILMMPRETNYSLLSSHHMKKAITELNTAGAKNGSAMLTLDVFLSWHLYNSAENILEIAMLQGI